MQLPCAEVSGYRVPGPGVAAIKPHSPGKALGPAAMQLFLLASIGGAIGAGARYLVNVACAACLAPGFPWATLIVNVLGSFLMGLVVSLIVPWLGGSQAWRTFLATGILGGFTTFSAFSLDVHSLFERQFNGHLFLYVAGSVVLSVLALFAGMGLGRLGLK